MLPLSTIYTRTILTLYQIECGGVRVYVFRCTLLAKPRQGCVQMVDGRCSISFSHTRCHSLPLAVYSDIYIDIDSIFFLRLTSRATLALHFHFTHHNTCGRMAAAVCVRAKRFSPVLFSFDLVHGSFYSSPIHCSRPIHIS